MEVSSALIIGVFVLCLLSQECSAFVTVLCHQCTHQGCKTQNAIKPQQN